MSRLTLSILGVAIVFACASTGVGQDAYLGSKARVELCWVETTPIEGVTREEGFQTSCDPRDMAYPHKEAALVLTSTNVTEAILTSHSIARTQRHMVTLHLAKEARDQLAATVSGKQTKLLTVIVDGKCWGIRRYELDEEKQFVPEQARAKMFSPDVGFFSSEAEARRLVNTFK